MSADVKPITPPQTSGKTYASGAIVALAALVGVVWPEYSDVVWKVIAFGAGLGIIGFRHALAKQSALLIFGVCLLMGCGSLPGGAQSPGTAGAPATALAAAQTVGQDQASVGGTATGGTGTINWYFASQASSEVILRLIEIGARSNWTADQFTDAIKATNGAPDTVTITNENVTNQGGNADNAGAGTGGAQGATGGDVPPRP